MFGRLWPQILVVNNGAPSEAPGLLSSSASGSQAATQIDPVAVQRALEARVVAAQVYCDAHADYLQADAEYRNAYNGVYISEGGPEHLRKAVAEERASGERAARDVAEVAKVAAEQAVRVAELGWRSAMAGAAPLEAGDQ